MHGLLFIQLEEEFSAIKPEARPLRIMWSKYRDPILNVAKIRAGKDLEVNDLLKDWQELDEGMSELCASFVFNIQRDPFTRNRIRFWFQ